MIKSYNGLACGVRKDELVLSKHSQRHRRKISVESPKTRENNLDLAPESILSNEDRTPEESGEKEREERRDPFEILDDDKEEESSSVAAG